MPIEWKQIIIDEAKTNFAMKDQLLKHKDSMGPFGALVTAKLRVVSAGSSFEDLVCSVAKELVSYFKS